MIDFYCDRLCKREVFLDFLSALCLSLKGLSEDELQIITKISQVDMFRMLHVFGEFLMCYKGYWVCSNEIFRVAIMEVYLKKSEAVKNELHKRIAYGIDKSPTCVRKLEEQTYQFYCCRDDFMLKKIIATVENFLMLFNPMTKFDLFRYWQLLEQGGYDPVTEYNKGIELFDTHYNPEADKLFVIILQVCRFLKEFSDFETSVTPVFRHPLIMDKIGVVKKKVTEKQKLEQAHRFDKDNEKNQDTKTSKAATSMEKMTATQDPPKVKIKSKADQQAEVKKTIKKKTHTSYKEAAAAMRRKNDPLGLKQPFYNDDNELSDPETKPKVRYAPAKPSEEKKENDPAETFNYLDQIGLLSELKKFKLTAAEDPLEQRKHEEERQKQNQALKLSYDQKIEKKRRFEDILEAWEDINIDIPEARASFREYFVNKIKEKFAYKERIKQRDEDERMAPTKKKARDDSDEEADRISQAKGQSAEDAFKEEEEFRHFYLLKMDDIDLEIKPEKIPSYYYYKRWIWIIFPWACLSIKADLNFSEVIARCYSSATKYMRIDEEKQFYKNALQIAIEYRLKKKAIYASKHPENTSPEEIAKALAEEEERAKQQRLQKLIEAYNRQLKEDEMVTFSNTLVKKEDYERSIARLLPAKSPRARAARKLPALNSSIASGTTMPGLSHSRSQATIRPNLKGINPRSDLFLTNVDGSTITVENMSSLR